MTLPTKVRAPRKRKAPEPVYAVFGQRLREHRIARGFTQAQVAQASGMSQNRMPGIEAGKIDVKLSTAHALAFAVGAKLRDLLPD